MTEITQADRDAAAEAFYCKPLRNEKHNDDRRVKAFARHREQATEALQAENARLREALVMAFRAIDYNNDTHPYEPMSDFFPMVPQGSKIQSLSDARAALQEAEQ